MHSERIHPVSGHVRCVPRKRASQWYAKYRLPDGRQVQKKLGPAWTGNGRPPAGYFTKRTAQQALQAILTDARRGTLPGQTSTGATFGDAAMEWLRHAEHERHLKPSTLRDYRSAVNAHLLPAFGSMRLEAVTTRVIEQWRARGIAEGRLPRRTASKLLAILNGIFQRARRVWGLPMNPVADVERHRERYSGDFDFFSPEDVMALVRAAESEQDGALFLAAAFTGLRRGELLALRWRDIDFVKEKITVRASFTAGEVGTPKSGRVRSLPMVEALAIALAKLGQRNVFTSPDDLVFPGVAGEHLDGSALRRRYVRALGAAGLRQLRFHDLRHTFGSLAINNASIVQVKEWMGHADVDTTMRYLHHRSRSDEAQLLAEAFRVEEPVAVVTEAV